MQDMKDYSPFSIKAPYRLKFEFCGKDDSYYLIIYFLSLSTVYTKLSPL
jgi:hypothetical protein